ncbi:hypothetical protein JAAARDRAFT_193093 [Jaapia argillacea MUCL 33604]|uniref:Major facilitator superfamily (MFS) profile domain-containing protein n=1 Tax=Jaapia argillacea MUCL 33604 TaxID=933084 RepID=A0A067PUZ6_9AGAM|nr:hypothetical protein JAAARDRAFT_193093 [Jaapia argillacea MUCL 33604]
MPPTRIFGTDESPLDVDSNPLVGPPQSSQPNRKPPGRISFSNITHRPGIISRLRGVNNDEENALDVGSPGSERPLIPSALSQPGEEYSTPLPVLPLVVLSITMLGEFLSANVSAPFLLFMVKGFGGFKDDADAGFWTGILVSTFFLTQFFTSLLWATVAQKHGQRAVLCISLLGTACTCCMFGTSTSLKEAIAIRLMQGVFAGAIGVARGTITNITDPSNEGRAYAILGFCWGFGGVSGAIIGGTFESPAKKWPTVFASIPLFVSYPYLLPCAVASSITFTGAILSLFLGWDAGPREGAIKLPLEKATGRHPTIPEADEEPVTPIFEDEVEPRGFGSLPRRVGKKISGYFARRVHDAQTDASSLTPRDQQQAVPLSVSAPRGDSTRTFSRTSRADGSAYGYGRSYRSRLASGTTLGMRRGSGSSAVRRRLYSGADGRRGSGAGGEGGGGASVGEMNFAQRLLMANENAVTGIADLWVAAAMNVDNEEVFESDTEMMEDEQREDEQWLRDREMVGRVGEESDEDAFEEEEEEDYGEALPSSLTSDRVRAGRRDSKATHQSTDMGPAHSGARPSFGSQRPSFSRPTFISPANRQFSSSSFRLDDTSSPRTRRYSTAVPSIFSHSGVRTPPAVLDAQELLSRSEEPIGGDGLATIIESQRASVVTVEGEIEKPPSLFWQLPLTIIVQYGLLALHSTTHDQVFYLYLVTDYEGGGLNLNAGNFSQLIALMCLAQIAYQFYLYPNIGPPRGRFSHLAMFRLGSLLFIPAYLTVTLYRPFASASEDGNVLLMAALAISTALRFCGITFAYTAVAILLNYMSPPHVVGLANGIAQSIVSLARFLGPIIGGLLWSTSVAKDPSGYALGFLACSAICALAVAHTFFIR